MAENDDNKHYEEVTLPGAAEPTRIIVADDHDHEQIPVQAFADTEDVRTADLDAVDREYKEVDVVNSSRNTRVLVKAGDQEYSESGELVLEAQQATYASDRHVQLVTDDKGRKYAEIYHMNSERPTRVLVAAAGEEVNPAFVATLNTRATDEEKIKAGAISPPTTVAKNVKVAEKEAQKEAKDAPIALEGAVMRSAPEGYATGGTSAEDEAKFDASDSADGGKAPAKKAAAKKAAAPKAAAKDKDSE